MKQDKIHKAAEKPRQRKERKENTRGVWRSPISRWSEKRNQLNYRKQDDKGKTNDNIIVQKPWAPTNLAITRNERKKTHGVKTLDVNETRQNTQSCRKTEAKKREKGKHEGFWRSPISRFDS